MAWRGTRAWREASSGPQTREGCWGEAAVRQRRPVRRGGTRHASAWPRAAGAKSAAHTAAGARAALSLHTQSDTLLTAEEQRPGVLSHLPGTPVGPHLERAPGRARPCRERRLAPQLPTRPQPPSPTPPARALLPRI